MGVLAAGLAAVLLVSRIPLPYLFRGFFPLLLLLLLTFALQAFTLPGQPLWRIGPFQMTIEGATRGGFLSVRLALLFMSGALLVMTTAPVSLTDGLAWYMAPLDRVGFPAADVALMMSIALRFIPMLLRQFSELLMAQRARGIEVGFRSLRGLSAGLMPLVVPLFVQSFRQADVLATAMESRCYRGGRHRTHYRQMRFRVTDGVAMMVLVLYLAVALGVGRFFG
jgi:energy-coupling factor transport system permease protein